MVVDPHDPDDRKADDVRRQRRPLRAELMGQILIRAGLGDRQDQQCDGDGEHSIAERLNPGLVHRRTASLPVGPGERQDGQDVALRFDATSPSVRPRRRSASLYDLGEHGHSSWSTGPLVGPATLGVSESASVRP